MRGVTVVTSISAALALLFGLAAGAHGTRLVTPRITRVVFGGAPTHPTVTVRGIHLRNGRALTPNPSTSPSNQPPLCPVEIKGNAGLDYGTQLFLADNTPKPVWAAGRYRPQLGELDCIGLIVTSYTDARVAFRFGADFRQGGYRLTPGDAVTIRVNGAEASVRVKYGGSGVAPGHS